MEEDEMETRKMILYYYFLKHSKMIFLQIHMKLICNCIRIIKKNELPTVGVRVCI